MKRASEARGGGRSPLEVAWEIGRRDIKANRRVSLLMLLRYLVQPLIQAGLFWLLLGGILRLDFSRSVTAYPPFLLAGLLAWSFVSTAVGGAALCLSSVAADGARAHLSRSPVGTDACRLAPGPGAAILRIPGIGPAPGAYGANVDAWDRSQSRHLLCQPGPVLLVSGARDARSGPVLPPVHEWTRR